MLRWLGLYIGVPVVIILLGLRVEYTCYSDKPELRLKCPVPFLRVEVTPVEEVIDAQTETIEQLQQNLVEAQQQLGQIAQTEAEKQGLQVEIDQLRAQLNERTAAQASPTPQPQPQPRTPPVMSQGGLPLRGQQVDFKALFAPVRDTFETKEEFAARKAQLLLAYNQAVRQHDPKVQAGVARFSKENYNVDKGEFAISVAWRDWTGRLLVPSSQTVLKVGRDEARALYQEGVEKPVYVGLQAEGEGLRVQQAVLLALGGEIVLPPPPKLATYHDPLTGPEFALIPAGCFQMGSPAGEADRTSAEDPQHKVCFKEPFYLSKTEVTQAQWEKVMGSNPAHFKGANLPVEQVSWDDIQGFIRKLNAGGRQCFGLPTEAQWEYAARAGSTTAFWWGNQASHEYANYGKDRCCSGLAQGRAGSVGKYISGGIVCGERLGLA